MRQCKHGKKYPIYFKHLSHKLWCYTRISGPEKSCNNTREKMSCVDVANQLLIRHSPLAPLGQVDERQSPHGSQYKSFVEAFANYGG